MRGWFVVLTVLSGVGTFVTAVCVGNGLTLLLFVLTGVFWVLGFRVVEERKDV